MPKRVDHEERRRLISAAVRRIAADRGLEGVSLGEVAAEAGISKGLVQHYFPTKDAMLRHATATLRDQVRDRAAPTDLRSLLVSLLPLDATARSDALVATAFLVRALKDEEIAQRFRAGYAELRSVLTALLAAEHPGCPDPGAEADLLLAVVTGLSDAVLLGHHSPAGALALVDRHLARLSG
ncbi:TetR/AcrR family transcriptional regulator [Actinokineospora bangkokensis]|uniref:TetR family transcriptional regulator n=1 Tax=Actinokineospora bangkokensis TaxID=1193682 RepID=A0A1Q9LND3_9PSEU|nr:TetR/AcrR family transcriptional regulator [Actinokineospora bangkokensis]OLR93521.1 TetR family transcriptional regulator [Actinokineospora bangkokensis]